MKLKRQLNCTNSTLQADLRTVPRDTEVQAQLDNFESAIQTSEPKIPNEVNESLALENQELKAQLQALQQLVQTKDEEEAISQITTPSQSSNSPTDIEPLNRYFQTLTQLQNLSPARKYDCAMTLFEHGIGPSEASRILKVNKGSLQHYKDGKRPRPKEIEPKKDRTR